VYKRQGTLIVDSKELGIQESKLESPQLAPADEYTKQDPLFNKLDTQAANTPSNTEDPLPVKVGSNEFYVDTDTTHTTRMFAHFIITVIALGLVVLVTLRQYEIRHQHPRL